jgi:hypothetical protein
MLTVAMPQAPDLVACPTEHAPIFAVSVVNATSGIAAHGNCRPSTVLCDEMRVGATHLCLAVRLPRSTAISISPVGEGAIGIPRATGIALTGGKIETFVVREHAQSFGKWGPGAIGVATLWALVGRTGSCQAL